MWVGMCVGLFFLMVRQPTRSTRTEHTLALHYSLTISPAELYAHSRHDKARTSMPNRQKHAESCGSKDIAQRRNGRSRPFARRGFDDSITRRQGDEPAEREEQTGPTPVGPGPRLTLSHCLPHAICAAHIL